MLRRALLVVVMAGGCFTKPDRPLATSDSGGNGVPPNLAFVTSKAFALNTIASLDVADRHCMEAAASGAIEGTYRAWLSLAGQPARSRMGGARGWVRVDGKPFLDRIEDALEPTYRIYYPLRIDEHGNDVYASGLLQPVATGTSPQGELSTNLTGSTHENCSGLSGSGSIRYGVPDGAGRAWTADSLISCSSLMMHLYCFGIDRVSQIDSPTMAGPRVFVSDRNISPANGRGSFDTRCQTDAVTAGLQGEFRAVTASTATSALEHIGGAGPTWVRVDGVAVTSDLQTFQAPISVTAGNAYLDRGSAWTGAMEPTALGTNLDSCADWSIGTFDDVGRVGNVVRSTGVAFSSTALGCNDSSMEGRVYCAQLP